MVKNMTEKAPKVSINICTYNRKHLLDLSLQSIFKQEGNGVDFEVVVIDDGGSDDTENYIVNKYPKVKYRYFDNHGYLLDGSSQAYNLAADLSSGDIIIQQNAECYHYSPNVIATLADEVKEHQPVFATVINRDGDPATITEKEIEYATTEGVPNNVHYGGKYRKVPWFFCGAIMRKDWEDLGGYKVQQFGVDVEFGERMIANGYDFKWLDEVVVVHQSHDKK